MIKELDGYKFNFVSKIEPKKDENGIIICYNPKDLYKKKDFINLNRYGTKSFCYFDIKKYSDKSGVYALFVNDNTLPEYIGRAKNFDSRWSRVNYGSISPKNCYIGGQSTNCHINSYIYEETSSGNEISLYYYETEDYINIEKQLICKYQPKLNTQKC